VKEAGFLFLEVVFSVAVAGCSSSGASSVPDATASDQDVAQTESGADAGDAGDSLDAAAVQADCGALVWNTDTCAACTTAHCCALEALCVAIPSCEPLSECAAACGADAGCATACSATYIPAASNYNAVRNCQFNSCNAECAR
jgi:hypothetical protein